MLTWKPTGSGSCCMVSLISSPGLSSSMTASWCVAAVTSISLTSKMRSPIRSLPELAAMPAGTTCWWYRWMNGICWCCVQLLFWLLAMLHQPLNTYMRYEYSWFSQSKRNAWMICTTNNTETQWSLIFRKCDLL